MASDQWLVDVYCLGNSIAPSKNGAQVNSIAVIVHSLDLTLECIDEGRPILLILRTASAGSRDLEKISIVLVIHSDDLLQFA